MHYFGSKKTLLPFLEQSIKTKVWDNFKGLKFFDAFSWTSIVGSHFKKLGCEVFSNDLTTYAYSIARHSIGNNKPMFFNGLFYLLPELNLAFNDEKNVEKVFNWLDKESYKNKTPWVIVSLYCQMWTQDLEIPRNYYTNENGLRIDWIRKTIQEWFDWWFITEDEFYWLLASLIEASDKRSNWASCYVSFLKHQKKTVVKPLEFKPVPFIESQCPCKAFQWDSNALIGEIECDILYLDPPYNSRQYAWYYHVLETLAKYDNPEVKWVTGVRDYSHQVSDYSSKARVEKAFEELIENAKAKWIFMSYNNDGLMSFETIKNIMSKRWEYGCFEQGYRKLITSDTEKLNYGDLKTTEYLHWVKIK